MPQQTPRGNVVIVVSFIVAIVLTMFPLPDWANVARPAWVALVLIYWCMAMPQRVGIATGWLAGLMLDVAIGGLMGVYAFAFALVAFLTIKLYQRIRVYPLAQQSLAIMILIAMSQLLSLWIHGIVGTPPYSWTYWLPTLTSTLLWPWLFMFMRGVRRYYRVQ